MPIVTATQPHRTESPTIAADAGYHSEANRKALAAKGIDAYLPDIGYRKRDARHKDQEIHKAKPDPLWDKRLYRNGGNCTRRSHRHQIQQRPTRLPVSIALNVCASPTRPRVSFFQGTRGGPSYTDKMKLKIDSDAGREMITRRFATVEPVFGNLQGNKRLTRFTPRGQIKVDGQWKLYCLVHNLEKLAHHGYAIQ